jgi:hypothetical protein
MPGCPDARIGNWGLGIGDPQSGFVLKEPVNEPATGSFAKGIVAGSAAGGGSLRGWPAPTPQLAPVAERAQLAPPCGPYRHRPPGAFPYAFYKLRLIGYNKFIGCYVRHVSLQAYFLISAFINDEYSTIL